MREREVRQPFENINLEKDKYSLQESLLEKQIDANNHENSFITTIQLTHR